ncbi:MAG: HNH endonuclease [Gammaproteobacteria bacterium]|nr:HNH endonuclease [Gammaproteobacteria bacterium]MBU2249560.1 HNH endonuclease [Gammaproteobacteria bacterium]MBU2296705.1 HNH endonuclease [Gammaproteobacteria bacterium]
MIRLSEKDKEKFWSKVDIKTPEECWNWLAGINADGYGNFYHIYKTYSASRISWMLTNGDIPEGLLCLHRCDNRACINPSHLYLGTHSRNNLDREHRNPGTSGRKSKLGAEGIREVQRLFNEGHKQKELAEQFGLSIGQIHRLCKGTSGNYTIEKGI